MVQHWLDDDSDVPESEFRGVVCPACTRLHLTPNPASCSERSLGAGSDGAQHGLVSYLRYRARYFDRRNFSAPRDIEAASVGGRFRECQVVGHRDKSGRAR